MFEPPRRSPLAARERSACSACIPFPRSTRAKQFDLRTNTLISASGEPRPASRHQSDSGSTTERVPSFFEHTGISADFSSRIFWADLAKAGIGAAIVDHNATTDTEFCTFVRIYLY